MSLIFWDPRPKLPFHTDIRAAPSASEATPCPSLIVSSVAMNGTSPPATGAPKPAFTGGAHHLAGSFGAVAAVGAAVVAFVL